MVQAEEETEEKLAKQPLKNGETGICDQTAISQQSTKISSYDNGGIFF